MQITCPTTTPPPPEGPCLAPLLEEPESSMTESSCWTVAALRWPGPLLEVCPPFQGSPVLHPKDTMRRLSMEKSRTITPLLLLTRAVLVMTHSLKWTSRWKKRWSGAHFYFSLSLKQISLRHHVLSSIMFVTLDCLMQNKLFSLCFKAQNFVLFFLFFWNVWKRAFLSGCKLEITTKKYLTTTMPHRWVTWALERNTNVILIIHSFQKRLPLTVLS